MPTYQAPLEDFSFLLHDFLKVHERKDLPPFADLTPDTTEAVLRGGAEFCTNVLLPLSSVGDTQGCHLDNGVVRTPKGFKQGYDKFCADGWNRLSAPESMGGASLPPVMTFLFAEICNSTNQAFSMYSGLTTAAASALAATGEAWMKQHILPSMVSGAWTGTMCLTEAHCGTDLKLMKTRAIPMEDGTYRLTGTKIFISGGDHDMTDNIIHMVLAKVPDAQGNFSDTLASVNFFMVPKNLVNSETGALEAGNNVTCIAVENKMGIKGSATCTLSFDNSVAYRLGAPQKSDNKTSPKSDSKENSKENSKKSSSAGMAGMFGMMNAARLGVGIQGIAVAEIAAQNAANYARERLAGRGFTSKKEKRASADPIIAHPDVRRMLLELHSFVGGARALATFVSYLLTVSQHSPDEKERIEAGDLSQLLTPVIKAFFTDMGFAGANTALQCFGGHGYIRDYGMEQMVRDARINPVYEGTNGVQAIDLVGRKLAANGGRAVSTFFKMIDDFLLQDDEESMAPFMAPLRDGLACLKDATAWLAKAGGDNVNDVLAGATDYLRLFGLVSCGFMWARQMRIILQEKPGRHGEDFYERKTIAARFFMERVMPETTTLVARLKSGSTTIMSMKAENF